MNSMTLKTVLSITALVSAFGLHGNGCTPSPTFVPRSQGSNSVLKLVGSVGHTHLYDKECLWGTFALTPFYSQSFRGYHITDCLFGPDALCNVNNCTTTNDCTCDDKDRTIIIQGSEVANRNPNAWLADYFYLPTDFQSQISFRPKIQNFLLNVDLYLGLDQWVCGMYFRVYGPFNWTKWDLNFCETICATGSNSQTAGYFTPAGAQRSELLDDFASYARGEAPAAMGGVTFGGLRYARIDGCEETRTGFADLWLELGWDFLSCEDWHVGVGVLAGAPTGNKRHACRVFDPVIGNGNHWQLGGVATGHYVFWKSCDEDRQLGFYIDANVTHLFNAREERTFDLCLKENSRYMLAERFTQTSFSTTAGVPVTVGNLGGNSNAGVGAASTTAAVAQFANEFTPVANLTTFYSDIKIGVQGDVSAMINYSACNFSLDLGYNLWARSCETISCENCELSCNVTNLCDPREDRRWALKGDARVFGFAAATNGVTINDPIALSATQSNATIHGGTNATATTSTNVITPALQNEGVDLAQFARAGTNFNVRVIHTPPNQGGLNVNNNQIKTSIQPIFLDCQDIDFRGTRGLSHKVFTHLSYTWERECWIPYLGVGGSAEFGRHKSECSPTCNNGCTTLQTSACQPCTDCALSQWAVWVKGGASFN